MKKPCNAQAKHVGAIANAVVALFAASYGPVAFANPTGAVVVAGTVDVATPGAGKMNITQGTPKAIVNWNTFSIGANEGVTIVQPSASAALLNRVMTNNASVIAGQLRANGKVFLVNPAGVIFSPGSSVNVGSLVASTLNISNQDFLAGNYRFVGASAMPVSNAGTLTAGTGGTIALLGGTVSNAGTVSARLGTVALGAGNDITLDFAGDGLTTLKINQGAAKALIGNTGTLAADGGMVVMSAQTADALADTVINQQGIVRAQSLTERNGHIVLDGGTNGVVMAGGTLDATGGAGLTGGRVDVTGYNVALLDGARVDASGDAGGGKVRFGGGAAGGDADIRNANAVWMSPTASIHADALTNGSGGNVVAYSDTASRIYGTLTARGGAQDGDGGLIETSGHYLDTAGARVDASAVNGKGGTWLIDPSDIEICKGTSAGVCNTPPRIGLTLNDTLTPISSVLAAAVSVPSMFGPSPGVDLTTVTDAQISDSLNANTSVQIKTTEGSITVNGTASPGGAAAVKKTGGTGSTLTLSASGSILIDYGASISSTTGKLDIVLDSNVGSKAPDSSVSIGTLQHYGTLTTIATSGGNVVINDSGGFSATSANIDTQGGNLQITGNGAVMIDSSEIKTEAGNLSINGTSTGSAAGIRVSSSSLATTSGAISMTGTVNVQSGSFAILDGISIDGGGRSVTTDSGAISMTGTVTVPSTGTVKVGDDRSAGLYLTGVSVSSASGTITLTGMSSGYTSSISLAGVIMQGNADRADAPVITTGSGTLRIFGSGTGTQTEGVLIADGTRILSINGGDIDIRGAVAGPLASRAGAANPQDDFGVLVPNGSVTTEGATGNIAITGSTSTSDLGIGFGGVLKKPSYHKQPSSVTISTAYPGTIALRASNDGTASSLASTGTTTEPIVILSPGGVLAVMPGSVDPANSFTVTAQDATPISLFVTGGGLSIDAETFGSFSKTFNTMIFGSTTQTGRISVGCKGVSACTQTPAFATNLTFSNPAAGSQGIELLYGAMMQGYTLTLSSAGAVTDPGGIQAANLLLSGPGSFTLTDPQNDVGVLAMVNAGNVNFVDSHGFAIGPVITQTYDSNSHTLTTIDGTNSTLTGNLIAQAANGNIALNTSLAAGGTVDLVMENGIFSAGGSAALSAANGWRIWASTWNQEVRGNVQPNTAQPNFYGCTYGEGCSWSGTVPLTGNHFVYVARPTVTVTANDAKRLAGGFNPTFTFTVSGLINGDTAVGTLSGSLTTPANQNSPTGTYPINPNFASTVGYFVIEVPGTLNVITIDQARVVGDYVHFFGSTQQTFVYENNLQGTNICIGSNQPFFTTAPSGQKPDLLAVEWKRVRSQPNLNSCLLLNSEHACGDF